MSRGDAIKKEFQLSNFGLDYQKPSKFVTPRCGSRGLFFVWIGVSAFYHTVNLFLEIYWVYREEGRYNFEWLLFLTNWSYIWLTFTTLWDVACVIHVHLRRRDILEDQMPDEVRHTPWYLKMNWLLFTTNSTVAVLVTVVFWTILVDPELHRNFNSFNKHAINLAYAFPNFMYSAKPFRLYHVYMPFSFFGAYLFFSVIHFYASRGGYMYEVVNWSNPASAIKLTFPLLFVAVPLTHILLFLFSKLSCYISSKCCQRKDTVV